MKIACIAVFVASTALASVASAQPYDTTALFQAGAWQVEHTYNTNADTSWCSADTTNRTGQSLSVVGYANGAAAVFVGDPKWDLSERSVRFRVDIDYSRWDIDGSGEGSTVSVLLNDADGAVTFLGELMESSAVAVYNDSDRRLATFSLDGSRSAIIALVECWRMIDETDPFTRASDPF